LTIKTASWVQGLADMAVKYIKAAAMLLLITMIGGYLMASDGVTREVLENGVTVIIKENHSAQVAAVNFWVRVGSAYENADEKGMTHFIEHLLFKGTEKRGVGIIDREIKELGGYNNAFTSYDATNFVIVLPSEHIEKAIEIEHDALTSSVFDNEELLKEREVVITELKRGIDTPQVYLWQKLMKQSFDSFYNDPIIGYEETLRKMDRPQVYGFYKKYYEPQNLIVVVSGDVDTQKMLGRIRETFGSIPSAGVKNDGAAQPFSQKPAVFSAHFGNIESRYVLAAYRIPDALSKDISALEALARVLGGSESSFLYRKLKEEKQLVDEIDCDIFSGKFGGLFVISANVREGKFKELMSGIFELTEELKRTGIPAEALNRVKSDILTEQARENMKVENAALSLGYWELLGDYRGYYAYNDAMTRLTTGDLNAALRKYIIHDNVSVAAYYPQKASKELSAFKDAASVTALKPPALGPEEATGSVSMKVLPNGITLLHKRLVNSDIVAIKASFKGGIIYEGADDGIRRGITNLMMETMFKGTKTRDDRQIAEQLDELGVSIGKDIGKDTFGWAAEMMPYNCGKFMDIFSDIVLNPAFEETQVDKEKKAVRNLIIRRKDNPAAYAVKLFNELLFEWHPYGYAAAGELETINGLTPRKIRDWHRARLAPNFMTISFVGNISMQEAENLVTSRFGAWKKVKALSPKLPVKITGIKKEKTEVIDKNQVHIVVGFLGPKTDPEDYYAFRVLDAVLSGGMDSRLFSEVREKRNLCYTVYSTFDRNVERGAFRVYTATDPEREQEALDAIMAVLKDVRDNGITDRELQSAKNYISGMYKVGFQDYSAQADSYASYEMMGLGYRRVDTFADDINLVTKEDVLRVAKKYFDLEDYTIVKLGPKKQKGKGK